MSRGEVGLAEIHGRRAWTAAIAVTLLLVTLSFAVNHMVCDHEQPSRETWWFEATMPGLAEELAFRGVLFASIGRAFSLPVAWRRDAAALIVTSLVFGLWHGLSLKMVSSGSFGCPSHSPSPLASCSL